jgi:hypothetical protein
MLLLAQVDCTLLRKDESRKHLEWRLRGNTVCNLGKTSGMQTKSFTNTCYILLSLSIFLTIRTCFAFKKYRPTDTSKFTFQALTRFEGVYENTDYITMNASGQAYG